MKFETELEYIGAYFLVKGTLSSADELEVESVSVWTGNNYVAIQVDVRRFAYDMEDYIREQLENDAESARDNYYEDKYDEEKLESL